MSSYPHPSAPARKEPLLIFGIVIIVIAIFLAWLGHERNAPIATPGDKSVAAPVPAATLPEAQVPAVDAARRSIRFVPPAPGADGGKPLVHIVYPSSSVPDSTGKNSTTNNAGHQ